jgi:hypothetical protein
MGGRKIVSSLKHPDWFCSLFFNEYWGYGSWGVQLTTQLCRIPSLRMNGTVTLLPLYAS